MAEYVPIFLDWIQVTEELTAQEKGRLIDAIVIYAMGGDWQDQIKGNERYLFPAFKRQIDRALELKESRRGAGLKGVEQRESNASKRKQTEANASKRKQTQAKSHTNTNTNTSTNTSTSMTPLNPPTGGGDGFARFWSAYPKKAAKSVAVKAWEKLNPDADLVQTILAALELQRASPQWRKDNGQFIPLPATWLNQRRWEDEVSAGTVYNPFDAPLEELLGGDVP